MAVNFVSDGRHVQLTVSGAVSGDPVAVGQIIGVVFDNAATIGGVANQVEVERRGIFNLVVQGSDDSGGSNADANNAVAIGDQLYINMAKTPVAGSVSRVAKRNVTGVAFGKALGTVSAGAVATIPVLLG